MNEYLIFVTRINDNLYQLDFTTDAETAWGENWHIAPAAFVPNIAPEKNAISNSYRIETENLKLHTVQQNTCFSMQDCIDGIIALAFTDIDDDFQIVLPFACSLEDTMAVLQKFITKITHLKDDGSKAIEGLIDSLENE